MKRSRLILLVILSAMVSAGLTAWLTRAWPRDPQIKAEPPAPSRHEHDFHDWLHTNLELTPEQLEALAPTEERFEAERTRLLDELEAVSEKLAHALSDTTPKSQDLEEAMRKRHQLQGRLQELVIDHLLEKRALLTPAQRKQYREWIHESISHDHED